jgi:hypothetical protein
MHHIVMDGLHLCENESFYEILTGKASDLDWHLVRPKQRKGDMRFDNIKMDI